MLDIVSNFSLNYLTLMEIFIPSIMDTTKYFPSSRSSFSELDHSIEGWQFSIMFLRDEVFVWYLFEIFPSMTLVIFTSSYWYNTNVVW